MHETGCSGLVHWDDSEGWDGREVEGGLKMGNTCTPMADSCECMAKPLQYCKVISLQLKKKKDSWFDGAEFSSLLLVWKAFDFSIKSE